MNNGRRLLRVARKTTYTIGCISCLVVGNMNKMVIKSRRTKVLMSVRLMNCRSMHICRKFCLKLLKLQRVQKLSEEEWRAVNSKGISVKLEFLSIKTLALDLAYIKSKCGSKSWKLSIKCLDIDSKVCRNIMGEIKIEEIVDVNWWSEEIFIKLYKCVGDLKFGRFTRMIKIKSYSERVEKKAVKKKKGEESVVVSKSMASKWLVDYDGKKTGWIGMNRKEMYDEKNFIRFIKKLRESMKRIIVEKGNKICGEGFGLWGILANDGGKYASKIYRSTLLLINYLVAKRYADEKELAIVWVRERGERLSFEVERTAVGYKNFNN